MSNQEAIALLRNLEDSLDSYCGLSEEGKTAFRMAIEALSSSEFPNNSDCISRQAAIEALDEQIENCDKSLSSFDISMKDAYAVKVERASLVAFREILEYLPPAQPERGAIEQIKWERDVAIEQLKKLGYGLGEKIRAEKDCISRQAAIEAVNSLTYPSSLVDVKRKLADLPPAEPQIIYCKDCKYWIPYDWMFSEMWRSRNMADYPEDEIGCKYCDMSMKANDFCSRGERREVTE